MRKYKEFKNELSLSLSLSNYSRQKERRETQQYVAGSRENTENKIEFTGNDRWTIRYRYVRIILAFSCKCHSNSLKITSVWDVLK